MSNRISYCVSIVFILTALFPLMSFDPYILDSSEIHTEDENVHTAIIADYSGEANLTWKSRTQQVPQLLQNDSKVVGDHIVLNATFPINDNVTDCNMHIWDRFIFATTRFLTPTSILGGFGTYIYLNDCDWVAIRGFEIGDTVNITCNFTNANCDFYGWDGTLDSSQYTRSNNLLNMDGIDKPEQDSFIWSSENDTMILACHNYDNSSAGNWTAYIEVGNHFIQTEEGSSIEVDTYYFSNINQTYSLMVTGYTDLNESFEIYLENVEICNFFVPRTVVNVNTIFPDSLVFNISWSCEDQNQNDTNYFSLWISRNDGVTFVLLAQNYTRTWYVWNSTDWLEGTYLVRVRAYSVDFSSSECRVDNPPSSYWPGDYSDTISFPIDGGGFRHGMLPSISISTHELTYEYGSINNTVLVHVILNGFSVPISDQYRVRDNDSIWKQGVYYPTGDSFSFTINIDGLSIGTHDISIGLSYFAYYGHLTVVVTAPHVPSTTPTSTPQDWSPFMQSLAIGVSLGSIAIIAVVIILTLRLKRNPIAKYVEEI